MNDTKNPFVAASICAGAICHRMGWDTGAGDAEVSKSFRGTLKLVRELFEQAEADGRFDAVYAGLRHHVETDDIQRVRETVRMLMTGYGSLAPLLSGYARRNDLV